jgi:HAD superfamily hydrolase (TIGR01484 family)
VKQLVAFDLDGTLAESKQPIEPDMAALLTGLLGVTQVAVISGGDWPQFEKQVVGRLPADADLSRLWILPTTGAKLYRRGEGEAWERVYGDDFPGDERARILAAVDRAVAAAGLKEERTWGDRIEDRGTQFTFSALGQEAPLDAKKAWDPDMAKRKALQAALADVLPDLSVKIGGSTSIDITRQGVDKGWGLNRLAEESGIPLSDMIFLGDAVFPGGNDYPAQQAGVDTVAVRDVAETRAVIRGMTFCLRR